MDMRIPLSLRMLRDGLILQPASKFNTRNIDDTPINITQPDSQWKTDYPSNQEPKTILKIRLLADNAPDVGHERVSKRMKNGPVYDIERKGDLAEIL